MSIDDRLEALTHSVELMAGMQVDTEKRLASLIDRVDEFVRRSTMVQEAVATLSDGMAQLTRIAIDHDERIADLEGHDRPKQ